MLAAAKQKDRTAQRNLVALTLMVIPIGKTDCYIMPYPRTMRCTDFMTQKLDEGGTRLLLDKAGGWAGRNEPRVKTVDVPACNARLWADLQFCVTLLGWRNAFCSRHGLIQASLPLAQPFG
jgi:hypothetical protein